MTKEQKEKLKADPEGFVTQLLAEHKAEVDTLSGDKKELEAVVESNNEELEGLKAELEALQSENSTITGEVPGTYKAKNKKEYRFVKGCLKSRNLKGEIVPSVELLKDKEYMERMIELGAAIIEEV